MKIIIDCDMGIDDAIAVAYALALQDVDVLGIGSVHGNIEADVAAENTLKLLKVMNRTDIPVAVGAPKPMIRPLSMAKFVHGEDGLGNANFAPSGLVPSDEHAADQIIRLARENPGEITLITTGPLTNAAIALLKEPKLPQLIPHVVVMGGTVEHPGNVGPVSEANIAHDPEAAQIVFSAPWKVTMVGLDVTMKTLLLEQHLDAWKQARTPLTEWLLRIVPFYMQFYSQSLGYMACAMHDALAVGIAVGKVEVSESMTCPVWVNTAVGPGLGQTVADRRSENMRATSEPYYFIGESNTEVIMKVDGDAFVSHLVDSIASYQVR